MEGSEGGREKAKQVGCWRVGGWDGVREIEGGREEGR